MYSYIWILGTSGFAFDIAKQFVKVPGEGNCFMGFIDYRKENIKQCKMILEQHGMPYNVITPDEIDCSDIKNRFLLGVGEPAFKADFVSDYNISHDQIHDFRITVDFAEIASIQQGIYSGCKISSLTSVGVGNFIDNQAVIGHDCNIGNFNHIGVNVIIGGNTKIGHRNNIHSGAIIANDISIGDDCVIGAGANVLRDLPSGTKIIAPKSVKVN